jgi:channel protein (hemolysin III family)
VLLYGLSTLYHSVRRRAKAALQKIDHQRIYRLIAGSYTPFFLVTLRSRRCSRASSAASRSIGERDCRARG